MKSIRQMLWSAAALFAGADCAAQTSEVYAKTLELRMPIQMDDAVRRNVERVKLYCKGPDGDWQCVAGAAAGNTFFDYRVPEDGTYSFLYVLVDRNGRNYPDSLANARPQRIVVVDTRPPEAELKLIHAANGDTLLQANMVDANPDPRGVRLQVRSADGSWTWLQPINTESTNIFRVDAALAAAGSVRAMLRDRAGNETVKELNLPGSKPPIEVPAAFEVKSDPRPPAESLPMLPGIAAPARPSTDLVPAVPIAFETREVKQPAWPKPLPEPAPMPELPMTSEMVRIPRIETTARKPAVDLPPLSNDPPTISIPAVPPMPKETVAAPAPAKLPKSIGAAPPLTLPEIPKIVQASAAVPIPEPAIRIYQVDKLSCEIDYVPADPVVNRTDYWLTRDGGRRWEPLDNEAPRGRPLRVTVPGEGTFGLRIRPQGSDKPPAAGERPDCQIVVKLPEVGPGPSLKLPER